MADKGFKQRPLPSTLLKYSLFCQMTRLWNHLDVYNINNIKQRLWIIIFMNKQLLLTAMCLTRFCFMPDRNTSPIRHRPIRWITPLKHKNASPTRHHAPSSNAFRCLRIGAVKAWYSPSVFVQSPQSNTYLTWRYSLKCWPVRFTYKAPSLMRPVPYKWGITVCWKYTALLAEFSKIIPTVPIGSLRYEQPIHIFTYIGFSSSEWHINCNSYLKSELLRLPGDLIRAINSINVPNYALSYVYVKHCTT